MDKNKPTLPNIMANLLNISENSYYRWKKKDHKTLISLLEKYHSRDEIQEFIETGKIEKEDRLEELLGIEKKYNRIVHFY